jgi:hypothetical protein
MNSNLAQWQTEPKKSRTHEGARAYLKAWLIQDLASSMGSSPAALSALRASATTAVWASVERPTAKYD